MLPGYLLFTALSGFLLGASGASPYRVCLEESMVVLDEPSADPDKCQAEQCQVELVE